MHEDFIGYDKIIDDAMRSAVVKILKKIEKEGVKEKHHFIISFYTNHADVSMPKKLRDNYSDEMTIILQYQFRNLKVDKKTLNVEVSFSGVFEKISIPIDAISSFIDPSVNFGLQFERMDDDDDCFDPYDDGDEDDMSPEDTKKLQEEAIKNSKNVISLDSFKKQQKDKDKK